MLYLLILGSSLALDRNRLDALIDAQKNEISLLNKKLTVGFGENILIKSSSTLLRFES